MPMQIRVSAAVIYDARGRILTVRKRGTDMFQFPGGKPEAGESALDAAIRETQEELGLTLPAEHLRPLGTFTAPAANEFGTEVIADVFVCALPIAELGTPTPAAEIAELDWRLATDTSANTAPLLKDHVFPVLLR